MDTYNTIIAGSLVAAKEKEMTLGNRVNAFLTPTLQDEVVEEYNEYLLDLWAFIREAEEEAVHDSFKYFVIEFFVYLFMRIKNSSFIDDYS